MRSLPGGSGTASYLTANPSMKMAKIVIPCLRWITAEPMRMTTSKACNEAGVKLKILPPYLPDYNPIELSCSLLKRWVRRYIQLGSDERRYPDSSEFLRHTIEFSGVDDPATARADFRKAGVVFD